MKIIFFGLGSIGSRHARLIKENYKYGLYAYRHKKNFKKNSLEIKEVVDLKEIDKIKPDVAFITNPPDKHIKYAYFCAKKGIDLFIEKPLSNSKKGVDDLLKVIKRNNIKAYVAYCLRFHPVIMWMKNHFKKNKPIHMTVNASSYLPNWRKNTNHLKHYGAFKNTGGVILELSHEIDYIYHLLGEIENIKVNAKKVGNVTINSEDFADILLKLKNGVYCNLHLNFFSMLNRREIIIDFKDHTIVADLLENKITIYKNNKKRSISFNIVRDDIYISQLNYFFNNRKKSRMMNSLKEAVKVFDIIMKIKMAA